MSFSGSSREGENVGIAPSGGSGTAVALYTSLKSARSFDAKHGFSRWGGARNRADRVSDSLSVNQARNIIEAAQCAAAIGLPLNRHVTIHWERAGVPDCRAAAATSQFMKLASDWLAKRRPPAVKKTTKNKGGAVPQFAWVWVRENEAVSDPPKGSHVHILLHLPAGTTWGAWRPRRWLERISGQPYRARVIRTDRIGGTIRTAADDTGLYHANLASVVDYDLKGASAEVAMALGLERSKPQGRIIGKRAATSQNIGRTARKHG